MSDWLENPIYGLNSPDSFHEAMEELDMPVLSEVHELLLQSHGCMLTENIRPELEKYWSKSMAYKIQDAITSEFIFGITCLLTEIAVRTAKRASKKKEPT